ncbi:hypothetical protein DUNSADRAFT_6593 [Dunaliella salina]|uniref:Uncharacterized protein n=1 Tax=Dunaliella salina TaxID=3046 RepID=A0ABQ7GMY8_DUNSA|nr:hypothetical protein DUNSADRAFT_6593 [Dunaliella salina]|eukprot:KAF5835977.1 hypothetical protein DUNSADRAFT_6593 [Dunaliella salina]
MASVLATRGVPWSQAEHEGFLLGLEQLGKGNWRGISRTFVPTRTPTQVASHAQKYFLRAANGGSKRKSRFGGVTATYPACQPTKVPRTAGSPLADSCSPTNSHHMAAPVQQQQPSHLAPLPQTLPVTSSAALSAPIADTASHHHSPEASCKASPSAIAATANSLPFAPNPACPTLGVPLPVHPTNSQPQVQHDRSEGPAMRPTVYGVPCFPMLPTGGLMGCLLPGLLPLNVRHTSQPTQHHAPHHLHLPPTCVSALISQQQEQLHEQQQHLHEQQLLQEQQVQEQQQQWQQHQQQCAADLSYGPLHTLALASAGAERKEDRASDVIPGGGPVKQEGTASPAASNVSYDSSCSNHSTHDSTFLSAALRAGLCRPEPVRGCSAQVRNRNGNHWVIRGTDNWVIRGLK